MWAKRQPQPQGGRYNTTWQCAATIGTQAKSVRFATHLFFCETHRVRRAACPSSAPCKVKLENWIAPPFGGRRQHLGKWINSALRLLAELAAVGLAIDWNSERVEYECTLRGSPRIHTISLGSVKLGQPRCSRKRKDASVRPTSWPLSVDRPLSESVVLMPVKLGSGRHNQIAGHRPGRTGVTAWAAGLSVAAGAGASLRCDLAVTRRTGTVSDSTRTRHAQRTGSRGLRKEPLQRPRLPVEVRPGRENRRFSRR